MINRKPKVVSREKRAFARWATPVTFESMIDDDLIDTVWAAVWDATPEEEAELRALLCADSADAKNIRSKTGRPRLGVHRSGRHIYAQAVDRTLLDPADDARLRRMLDIVGLEEKHHDTTGVSPKVRKYGVRTIKKCTWSEPSTSFLPPTVPICRRADGDDARDEL